MHTEPGSASDAGAAGAARQGGHFLTFVLGDGLFATDIRVVREIIQHGPMTGMPLMPHFVRGVINLRGAVVPVIDLQARFGQAPARPGKKTCKVTWRSRSTSSTTRPWCARPCSTCWPTSPASH